MHRVIIAAVVDLVAICSASAIATLVVVVVVAVVCRMRDIQHGISQISRSIQSADRSFGGFRGGKIAKCESFGGTTCPGGDDDSSIDHGSVGTECLDELFAGHTRVNALWERRGRVGRVRSRLVASQTSIGEKNGTQKNLPPGKFYRCLMNIWM